MIDKLKLKKNFPFIIISLIIVVGAIIITNSLEKNNNPLQKKSLSVDGNINISKLVINEIMSSNKGIYSDDKGNIYDWLELYNGNDEEINLKNYGLSDEDTKIKWVFPDYVLGAHEYLIVNLSNTKEEGLYATFKLDSNGGEIVSLKKPNGHVVDAVETVKLNSNESMARDSNGNWFTSDEPTPGYGNTKEGYDNYHSSLLSLGGSIKINEVLPKNSGNFIYNNELVGFIEIINIGDTNVDLSNYKISNSKEIPFKYPIGNVTLKPNEVLVLYNKTKEKNSPDFNFETKTGSAVLSYNNKIVDVIDYDDLANGLALKRDNDNIIKTNSISPGYLNNNDGVKKFSKAYLSNPKELIINEVMNSNYNYLPQNGNTYYDWIELLNNSNETINLSDYSLSTDNDIKNMYILPNLNLKPGELYVVMASGNTNLSTNYFHTNFKLSDIESLFLYKKDNLVDSLFIASIPLGYSMGRSNEYGFYYFETPTPLKINGQGIMEISFTPMINTPSGIYNDVSSLNIDIVGTNIYYTLDGSTPTTSSNLYNSPILLTKSTVLKVANYEDGKLKSEIVTNSYIINENHTLPILSLSITRSDLSYLKNNPWNTEVEVSAYAELYEEDGSFKIPCGIKLFGGSARGLSKKSYTLRFRKKYGESSLNYRVFDNRDFSVFETLVVRSGSQDYKESLIRDELMTSLVEDGTDIDTQAYKPIILYVNGEYNGIYFLKEKVEQEFVSNHYNVDGENTNIIRIDGEINHGSSVSFHQLMNYVATHDMSNQEYYEYVKSKVNIEKLCDFWTAETYTANNDIINTRYFQNPAVDDGRWQMIFYDLDYAMYNLRHNYYVFSVNPGGMSDFHVSTVLLRNLMRNKEFKKTYVERISYNLKNTWSEEKVLNRIDELYNILSPELDREFAKWGNTRNHFEEEIEKLRNYGRNRIKYMVSYARNFFGLSEEDMQKYFGEWL